MNQFSLDTRPQVVSVLSILVYFCFLVPSTLLPGRTVRPPANTVEWQIALAREGLSPGSLDGVYGSQTRAALLAYQTAKGLPLSGDFDSATARVLKIQEPAFTQLQVS